MEKTQINPWTWQDKFQFSQAWRVDGAEKIVFLSGQGPLSPDGELVGEGDFDSQARRTLENLKTVLAEAGASFDDVVKVTVYLTDIRTLRDYARIKGEFIVGKQPASTAIAVVSLAIPGMMIEIEAIAVL